MSLLITHFIPIWISLKIWSFSTPTLSLRQRSCASIWQTWNSWRRSRCWIRATYFISVNTRCLPISLRITGSAAAIKQSRAPYCISAMELRSMWQVHRLWHLLIQHLKEALRMLMEFIQPSSSMMKFRSINKELILELAYLQSIKRSSISLMLLLLTVKFMRAMSSFKPAASCICWTATSKTT